MRVSKVAIFALAALTAYELTPEANASPNYPIPTREVETSNPVVSIKTVKSVQIQAVASSETRVPPQWKLREKSPDSIHPPSVSLVESRISTPVVTTQRSNMLTVPSTLSTSAVAEAPALTQIVSLQRAGSAALAIRQTSQAVPLASVNNSLAQRKDNSKPTTGFGKSEVKANDDQSLLANASPSVPSREEIDRLRNQLQGVEEDTAEFGDVLRGSPSLTIVTPTGFGADDNTGFISATYQGRTRYTDLDDGALGIGVGLGNARKAVGVELSYALASFGGTRDFGSGGFNIKVHRRLGDDTSVALGWNGFLNLGDDNDFEDSVYGAITKIFRTRDNINKPFSRIALTAGVGNGSFRTENDVDDDDGTINVFGSVALRVARPVSVIAEWTGQDLGVGVSVVPFKNLPFVITPAVRDITGAGDGARFVLGAGFAFKF